MGAVTDRSPLPELLLGEWACLGVLAGGRAHGYAVAQRLGRDGDLGRAWTLSRPMVYRCLAQLEEHGLVRPAGRAGPAARPRVVLELTPAGQRAIDRWLHEPATHLRDVRSEFLVKVLLATALERPIAGLLDAQRSMADRVERQLRDEQAERGARDPVVLWRLESVAALRRVIDQLR
jgi:DNA-binding PadR family transcriptional regulator